MDHTNVYYIILYTHIGKEKPYTPELRRRMLSFENVTWQFRAVVYKIYYYNTILLLTNDIAMLTTVACTHFEFSDLL